MKRLGAPRSHRPAWAGPASVAEHRVGAWRADSRDSAHSGPVAWAASHGGTAARDALSALEPDPWSERQIWPDCVD